MAPPTTIPGVPPNIALINGPMLLGNLFGYGLFGVLTVQVFLYHTRYERDPIWMKCLVYGVFIIDIVMTALATVTVWDGLAAGWGDLRTLVDLDWPFNVLPGFSGMVSSIVHFFFCWRIWKLAGSLILPCLIAIISITQWSLAFYTGIRSVQIGVPRIGEMKPFVIVWLGGSALADILITAAMVTILFRAGTKSAFQHTNSVVAKLIKLTVETGMTTTAGALIELVFFFAFPTNNMHFIPFLFLAKLYSNTLLATLNARATMGDRRAKPAALWEDDVSSGQISSTSSRIKPPNGVVQITTTTQRRNDPEVFMMEDRANDYSYAKKTNFLDFEGSNPGTGGYNGR